MVLKTLQRIPEFANLPIFELRALAERTHILCIPRGRWLIYSGQELPAFLYLARGKIETFDPSRVLRARESHVHHFYPGCGQARALQTSHILRIDAAQREFLLSRNQSMAEIKPEPGSMWLQEFLRTHMMQQLPQHQWRALIDTFKPIRIAAGNDFIREGEAGDACYVVESGHGVIHRGGKTLAHLGPGDFFGEDALISGKRRSANVSTLEDMQLHAVSQRSFRTLVLDSLIQFGHQPGQGVLLNLDPHCHVDATPFSLVLAHDLSRQMDPRPMYYIIGGSTGERALCAFLLIRRGFRATPLYKPETSQRQARPTDSVSLG